ncbi:MAG: serine/threonine protein kinase, partial [Deltaproteobacteria bacterium]
MDPERIGPYQLLEKLGSGGMGTVYLGKHAETGRLVALKLLTASLARESGFVERFDREINALRKLKNPHIVELFDAGQEGDNYYYAMEYVAGETLLHLMQREKRLPWRQAVEFAVQICQALKAAHDAGIIHRDLKPSNLLVTPEGVIKLTDFGVAQVFASDRLTVTGGIIGTAEYMSPEQAQGKRAGKQSDLYSLGAVLYAMVTGRTPFSGRTAVEVIQKHKFGLFDRPKLYVPDLPARVDDTICRLLEKEPEKRFPDALVLLRHLEQMVRLEDFSATGVTLADNSDDEMKATTVATTMRMQSSSSQAAGPATLMQSLIRAELEGPEKGVVSAIFNNTYVLIALLALLIAGGFWWFRPDAETPDEVFARSEAILRQDPGPEWLGVRKRLKALVDDDPETWRERVEPLLKKIDLYELTRSVRGAPERKSEGPRTEGERLLQLALHYRRIGDLPRAERTLAALHALLSGDEGQTNLDELTAKLLEEVRGQLAGADDRDSLLQGALERAAARFKAGEVA